MTSDDVDALLIAYLHAELPAADVAQLQARLVTDVALARRLMTIAVEEATLIRWSRGALAAQEIDAAELTLRTVKAMQSEIAPAASPEVAPPKAFPSLHWPKWGEMPGAGMLFSLLALVIVVGVIGVGMWLGRSHDLPGGPPIARVVRLENAVWAKGQVEIRAGTGIPQGWDLRLTQGKAEIEYPNGAQLVLTGPADFQMTDAMHGLLRSGQVGAYVPPSAMGYTINTAAVAVRDKGTRFGVRIDPQNGTEVHVFEGQVETRATSKANPNAEQQSLTMTQAAKFDPTGKLSDWLSPDYDAFAEQRLAPGVVRTSQNVHWLTKLPPSLEQGAFASDDDIFLLLESQNKDLPGPIAVTFAPPFGGTRSAYDRNIAMIGPGLRVDSYLLHYNGKGRKLAVAGDIEFEGQIVGVIARGTQLVATDKWLGAAGIAYENKDPGQRGLKGATKELPAPDVLNLGPRQNRIGIHCEAGRHTVAEVRILVQSK